MEDTKLKGETLALLEEIAKKKIERLYEYLLTEEGRDKLKDKNFKIGTLTAKFQLSKNEIDLYLDEVCLISQSKRTREVCEVIQELKKNISYKNGEQIILPKIKETPIVSYKKENDSDDKECPNIKNNEVIEEVKADSNKSKDEERLLAIEKALNEVDENENKKSSQTKKSIKLFSKINLNNKQLILMVAGILFTIFVIFKFISIIIGNKNIQRFQNTPVVQKNIKTNNNLPNNKSAISEIPTKSIVKPPMAHIQQKPIMREAEPKTIIKPSSMLNDPVNTFDDKMKSSNENQQNNINISNPPVISKRVEKPVEKQIFKKDIKTKIIPETKEPILEPKSLEVNKTNKMIVKKEKKLSFSMIQTLLDDGVIILGHEFIEYEEMVYKKGDVFYGYLIKKIKNSYIKLYSIENQLSKKIRVK